MNEELFKELEVDLANMTADRDSWYQQNINRIDDALKFAKEADELRAELVELRAILAGPVRPKSAS